MVSTKRNQKISVEKLETTLAELDNLSEKKQEELTLRQSIHYLRDKLLKALKKGYSYQDLSEILQQQEIVISAATLKQYLTERTKKSTSKKRYVGSVGKTKQAESVPDEGLEKETSSDKAQSQETSDDGFSQSDEETDEKLSIDTASAKKQDDSLLAGKAASEEDTETEASPKTVKSRARKTKRSDDISDEFNQY